MAEKKESKAKKLQEKLYLKRESSWNKLSEKERKTVFKFGEDYKQFLAKSKTERLCVKNIVESLTKNKFKNIETVKSVKTGDKVFKVVKDKSVIAFVVGKTKNKLKIVGSHLDSPRLDLKPAPVYEDSNLALFQTHYYGGIKKYQWVNRPLSLHGVIFTKKGKKVEISIGDQEGEPAFIIPDLLPHLGRDQMAKDAKKVIEGEDLNILVGNIPVQDEDVKEKVKFTVLEYLYDKYGIIEEDFYTAELELVPKENPVDIGFDKSMIGAYGQDDRVCAYTSLRAINEIKDPKFTAVAFFADKEEIGSLGNTGAASRILENFVYDYKDLANVKETVSRIMENTKAISADVTAGMNPNFKAVHDPKNASFLGFGVSVEKYGGGGGKYSTNDAHAEFMNELRLLIDKNKIAWQTGELGKIDIGGGGTIAMFMSKYGMDCVDAGPCVLGMHSPCEVTSKVDVYSSYQLYKVFMND